MTQVNTVNANKNFTISVANEKKSSYSFSTATKVVLAAAITMGSAYVLASFLNGNYSVFKDVNGSWNFCSITNSTKTTFTSSFFGVLSETKIAKNITRNCQIF